VYIPPVISPASGLGYYSQIKLVGAAGPASDIIFRRQSAAVKVVFMDPVAKAYTKLLDIVEIVE
jgi:hypothetical protein